MNNSENTFKLEKLRTISLLLAISMSILSQLPLFRVVLGIDTQLLIYPFWGALIFFTIFKNDSMNIKFITITIFPYLIFTFFLLIYQVFIGNKYFTSGLSIQIYVSLIITYMGYMNMDVIRKYFSYIVVAFAVCSLFLAVDIYLEYFRNYSFEEISYVFRSKNSAAFILLIAIIMMFANHSMQSRIIKIVRLFLSAIFIYLCTLMRSRAVLISIVFFILFWLYSSKLSRVVKLLVVLAIILLGVLVVVVPEWNQLIIQNILLNGQDSDDLDQISSNRLQYFDDFQLFSDDLLFGIGEYYIDNFYLETIINYGWPLGLFVICIAFLPIRALFFKGEYSNVTRFLTALVIVHLFNALFEGYAPFGPGAKCFTLWIFYGAWQKYKENGSDSKIVIS